MAIRIPAAGIKAVWPSNFAVPASNKMTVIVRAKLNLETPNQAHILIGNKRNSSNPGYQKFLCRVMGPEPMNHAYVKNAQAWTAVSSLGLNAHYFATKSVHANSRVFCMTHDFVAQTVKHRYIDSAGVETIETVGPDIGAYTLTSEENPLCAFAANDGSLPAEGDFEDICMWDDDIGDANWREIAGITTPGYYKNPLDYLASNRINWLDCGDLNSTTIDGKTRERITITGTATSITRGAGVSVRPAFVPLASTPSSLVDDVDGATYPTSGTWQITPIANVPNFIAFWSGKATGMAVPTPSGGGWEYTTVDSYAYIATRELVLFRFHPTNATPFNFTATFGAAGNHLYGTAQPFATINTPNDSSVIVQVNKALHTGTDIYATLASALQANSGSLTLIQLGATGVSITPVYPNTKIGDANSTAPANINGVCCNPAGSIEDHATAGASISNLAAMQFEITGLPTLPAASGGVNPYGVNPYGTSAARLGRRR